jgi:hypothetical protein
LRILDRLSAIDTTCAPAVPATGARPPGPYEFPARAPDALEQIQFLLGPVSVETTEHYLGCKQRLRGVVNDKIGLELLRGHVSGSPT